MTLAAQDIRLVLLITPGVHAYASEDIMEAVMENLLENAASFTAKGGVIEVTLRCDRDFAQIAVADRGPGVDPQHLGRIFDRYVSYRAQTCLPGEAPQAGDSHQGIGLWIAKRNVKGLGGTVTARNRRGRGFKVTVSLRAEL
jgi:two-component system sensor histidine kinase ChvG